MKFMPAARNIAIGCFLICNASVSYSQTQVKLKYSNSTVYAGIEVGAKGVKMSVLEIGRMPKQAVRLPS